MRDRTVRDERLTVEASYAHSTPYVMSLATRLSTFPFSRSSSVSSLFPLLVSPHLRLGFTSRSERVKSRKAMSERGNVRWDRAPTAGSLTRSILPLITSPAAGARRAPPGLRRDGNET